MSYHLYYDPVALEVTLVGMFQEKIYQNVFNKFFQQIFAKFMSFENIINFLVLGPSKLSRIFLGKISHLSLENLQFSGNIILRICRKFALELSRFGFPEIFSIIFLENSRYFSDGAEASGFIAKMDGNHFFKVIVYILITTIITT